jgi:glycosyltransferase involved in cell wall biosynthesis
MSDDTREQLISVVIPCYQEEGFITECLASVRAFTIPAGWDIEVLVVDGGSRDDTRRLVRQAVDQDNRFQLLDNPNRTQSSGLNIGIRASRGEYIMRLDAHSTYPIDYLAQCLETSLRTHSDNVGGLAVTRPAGKGYEAALTQALTTHRFGVGASFRTGVKEGPADTVPYGFFRRDTFERFGLFDERLARAQDYELNRRIVASGGKVWLNPRIVVQYFQQPTLRSFLRKQFFLDAPYNAYMWYLAPYSFTPRHAVTAAFALGLLVGIPAALVSRPLGTIVAAALALYALLALAASVQQANRYKQSRHVLCLPFCFLAYHLTHGVGVLAGLAKIASGSSPARRHASRWTADLGPAPAPTEIQPVLVSVIVPCYQERDFIVRCLASIRAFALPPGINVEVLVVDGGSTDGTRALVKEVAATDGRLVLLDNPRRIQATALNIGIRESRGDYILRLDAHSTYPVDYLAQCYGTALRTRADNIGGVFVTRARNSSYQASLVQALTTHWFGVGISFRTRAKEGAADTVPYGFFPREIFERYGLFDERLTRAQDYEFNKRIIDRGGRVWLNPNIVVEYSQQPTLKDFLRKQIFVDAPFNAYMWYIAPYTFTPRHAASALFALGIILGLPLALFSETAATVVGAVMAVYLLLALFASVQQSLRYGRLRHVLFLPLSFLGYHLAHGIGVLGGALRIVFGTQPTKRNDPPWSQQSSVPAMAAR